MRALAFTLLVLAAAVPSVARAQRIPAIPIPEEPSSTTPSFMGEPATPQPVSSPDPPRHPFMAPNGAGTLHVDAYQTDAHTAAGPLGRGRIVKSAFHAGDCGSHTFDAKGRLITVCVGLDSPRLTMFDPQTLDTLAVMILPPRQPSATPFQDFSGGGYFYLDHRDRVVVGTTTRHLWVVSTSSGFDVEDDYDLTSVIPLGDKLFSALPDWSGRIWFVTTAGRVGFVDPQSGAVQVTSTSEEIANSFAVDESGAVYIVTIKALYRFGVGEDGRPQVIWREEYPNSGVAKPGQVNAGSGTTPTVMGRQFVAITDNADPMNVLVYRRAPQVLGAREVCRVPVFAAGASATDNSLIATDRALVVENNYGYTGPGATLNGGLTAPGISRVDVDADGECRVAWTSEERSPTVVPKLSLANGLVYAYTKTGSEDDPWYLTAIDFRTGRTVFKTLTGTGLGFNNNYAPVTLRDGTAYLGVLGGLVSVRDAEPAPPPAAPPACDASSSLARAAARPNGRGLRFELHERTTVDVFQASSGRRLLGDRLIARFPGRGRSFRWAGAGGGDGVYVVRLRTAAETRRIALDRRGGRFSTRAAFERRRSCGGLRRFKLGRPVFAGPDRRPLTVSFRLAARARATLTLRRGDRVVRRMRLRARTAGRVRISARGARPGEHTIELRARVRGRTVRARLGARAL